MRERPVTVASATRSPDAGSHGEGPLDDAVALSIITVVRDAVGTIGATLESVASQGVRDLEHLVIDGGSTDGTIGVVRGAPGVRLVSDADHGIYDAFNRGLARARGRWLTLLNADDVYAHPGVVARVLEEAGRHPTVGIFHADLDWIDAGGRVVFGHRFTGTPVFDAEMPISHPTVFVARWVYERLGGFDASFRIAGDYDLLLRAHLAGVPMRHIDDVFVRMRVGGQSEDLLTAHLEMMRSWRRRTNRWPWRMALRATKRLLIEPHAPQASAALGALKRALAPRSPVQRCVHGPGSRRAPALRASL